MKKAFYLDVQPADSEAVEFTYFDEWEDDTTEAEITAAWSRSLETDSWLPPTIDGAVEIIAQDGRWAVYRGDESVEIYRRDDVVRELALGACWEVWDACESMKLDIGALDAVADAIEAATGERPDGAWRGCPE